MNKQLTSNIHTHFTHEAQFDAVNRDDVQCLIVPVYKNKQLGSAAQQLDTASNGHLTKVMNTANFSGKEGTVEMLFHVAGVQANAIMLAGCGDKATFDLDKLSTVAQKTTEALKKNKFLSAACLLDTSAKGSIQRVVMAVTDVTYAFNHYKSDLTAQGYALDQYILATDTTDETLNRAISTASGRDVAKELANHPGNICTPTYLANQATSIADHSPALTAEILEEADMETLGMGSLLSVGNGSVQPSKLIVLNYQAGDKDTQPIVLVGKGITFDSGGISLKPGANMDEMKFDMGGAASALGTMHAICAMELPINLVMIVASAENMPNSKATKPGDIVTSMSGKTIEVLNTDAEGRLVLCDALTYAERFNPKAVVDMATLTGACIIALGHHISALVGNNNDLATSLIEAGLEAGDEAWQLPMNDKYAKQLKSEFADLGNIGGRAAGTITAACFLSKFTEKYPWAHLDIAGTAWTGKRATGRPVALLTQYLINQSEG